MGEAQHPSMEELQSEFWKIMKANAGDSADARAAYQEQMAALEKRWRALPVEAWRGYISGFDKMDEALREEAVSIDLQALFGPFDTTPTVWQRRRAAGLAGTEHAELSTAELVRLFIDLALQAADAEGDPPEMERLRLELEPVELELEYRHELRALLPLYMHADIEVRARAAKASQFELPELSRSRLLAIDDPDWSEAVAAKGDYIGPADESGAGGDRLYRRTWLNDAEVGDLVAAYVERGLALWKEREEGYGIARPNRLIIQLWAIEKALKARNGDQRRALLRLLGHSNMEVRGRAAAACWEIAPEVVRPVLEAIAASRQVPQAGEAASAIERLKRGKPN